MMWSYSTTIISLTIGKVACITLNQQIMMPITPAYTNNKHTIFFSPAKYHHIIIKATQKNKIPKPQTPKFTESGTKNKKQKLPTSN